MSSLPLVLPEKLTSAGLAIVKKSIEILSKIKNRTIKDSTVPALADPEICRQLTHWEFHQQAAGPTTTDTEEHEQIQPLKIIPVGLRTCPCCPRRAQVASMSWRTVRG